jgi:hypothetical protein
MRIGKRVDQSLFRRTDGADAQVRRAEQVLQVLQLDVDHDQRLRQLTGDSVDHPASTRAHRRDLSGRSSTVAAQNSSAARNQC